MSERQEQEEFEIVENEDDLHDDQTDGDGGDDGDDSSDDQDDESDDRTAMGSDDEDDREAIRERRRQEKKERKQAQQEKETADNEYQSQLDALRADNQRMRNDRSRRNILPAAPAGSRDPETVCFDRAKFEQAVQRLDDGISRIIGTGDEDAEGLNVAKRWAKSLQ